MRKMLKQWTAAFLALASVLLISSCGEIVTPLGNEPGASEAESSQNSSLDSSSDPSSGEELSSEETESSEESVPSSEEPSSEPDSAPVSSSSPASSAPVASGGDTNYPAAFADAVFVGDSLTLGLSAYGILGSSQVLANVGINPNTILSTACIDTAAGTVTIREALKTMDCKRIYIMLGANGIAFLSTESILSGYGTFVDQVKADHPGAAIYLQSMLPVTKAKEAGDPNYSIAKIRALNEKIQAMAQQKGVNYLNVAEAVADGEGYLPAGESGDGMHIGPVTYRRWLDYILSH